MQGGAYGCVLAVLTGLQHIKLVLVVYQLDIRGNCGMVDLSVAVGWMVLEAVSMGGVLDNRKSVAFPHAALLRPHFQNLLFHFSPVVDLWR